jgi:aerobic-type carbon monoxide dehydrogenase small subunit (CoxS/CutS family)
MPAVKLSVNGTTRTLELDADARLLTVLRDVLGLTGTQVRVR